MNLLSVRFKKIALRYSKSEAEIDFQYRFINLPSRWFCKKKVNIILINLFLLDELRKEYPRSDAIHFMDCLIVCCLENIQNKKNDGVLSYQKALTKISKPFKKKRVYTFINSYLAFTAKENYRNLEIADTISFLS